MDILIFSLIVLLFYLVRCNVEVSNYRSYRDEEIEDWLDELSQNLNQPQRYIMTFKEWQEDNKKCK